MKAKNAILLVVIVLLTVILTGCPPQLPSADKITAKEAWNIIEPTKKTLSDDAVPVYIEGSYTLPETVIIKGKASIWNVGFYSENEKAVWVIGYYAESDRPEATPAPGEKRYDDVSLEVYNLEEWNIDSPEACDIAAQNGAGKTERMSLHTARLDVLDDDYDLFVTPEFIPESTKLFWVIWAGDIYYIDACTGEYLGCYTAKQLNNIEE